MAQPEEKLNGYFLDEFEPYHLNAREKGDEYGYMLRFATTTPFYDQCFRYYKEKDKVKECYKKSLVINKMIIDQILKDNQQ